MTDQALGDSLSDHNGMTDAVLTTLQQSLHVHEYRKNINLKIEHWLHDFIVISAIINLALAAFTFSFQLAHPKSRRNMGRFFLIILALQSVDKVNALLQELYIKDLSIPYYELDANVEVKSPETMVCQFMGFLTTFCDYMSQFYALWFAVLIKQIIKDPIHRLQKLICFFHVITFLISATLTGILAKYNTFGVQEDLQCGIMYTAGLDDELLMVVPFFLVPMQMYYISSINKQTPFIIRQSLKRFVKRYTIYMTMLMSMQCMQVAIVLFGSRNPNFFDYDIPDGFKRVRYGYILLDHLTFCCLVLCTLYEPVFQKKSKRFINKVLCKNRRSPRKIQYVQPLLLSSQNTLTRKDPNGEGGGSGDEKSFSMAFENRYNNQQSQRKTDSDSSEDDNFEEGSNQQIEMRSELDVVDKEKFENLVSDYANFNAQFQHMSIKQKTSYFIINTVLMSICHCLINANEQKENKKNIGLGENIIHAVKSLTYQLQENDIYHIMDVAAFYKKNADLCVSDLTNGKKVQIKISEYDREIVSKIRRKSGFDDTFFLKSFAPIENHVQMTRFQIGSGKSDSFFFYTANSQFIIKTLKEDELKLLVRKGILEKYYQHLKKNPNSMLARFYGIYTVKIKFMKPISVVIMDNLMGEYITEIQRIYDLKGSTHKRTTKVIKSVRTVRKDLNLLRDSEFSLKFTPEFQSEFKRRIYRDKEFLKSCNLMDYSLLLIFFKKIDWQDTESNGSWKNMKRSIYMKQTPNGNQEIEIEEVPANKEKPQTKVLFEAAGEEQSPKDQDVQPVLGNRNSIFDVLPLNKNWHNQEVRAASFDSGVNIGEGITPSRNSNFNQHTNMNQISNWPSTLQPRVRDFIEKKAADDSLCYYRFGIIDFLQAYTKKKKLETMYLRKRYKKKPPNCFSCVEPHAYGDRFYEFLLKNLFTSTRYYPEYEMDDKEKRNASIDNGIVAQSLDRKKKSWFN